MAVTWTEEQIEAETTQCYGWIEDVFTREGINIDSSTNTVNPTMVFMGTLGYREFDMVCSFSTPVDVEDLTNKLLAEFCIIGERPALTLTVTDLTANTMRANVKCY